MKIFLYIFLFILVLFIFMLRKKLFPFFYYLFLDLKHFDKTKFKGFGFWLFVGLGGSGKTMAMVEYLTRMKNKYPHLKVYTNFDYKLADGKINNWEDLINYENGDDGIIFGFDEIQLTFNSQQWDSAPQNLLEYVSQQRKLHKQIVASSQVFNRVNIILREQTNLVIECATLANRWTFIKAFHTPDYLLNGDLKDNGRKRSRAWRYNFIQTDYLRSLYDTYEIMVKLKTTKQSDKSKDYESLRYLLNK